MMTRDQVQALTTETLSTCTCWFLWIRTSAGSFTERSISDEGDYYLGRKLLMFLSAELLPVKGWFFWSTFSSCFSIFSSFSVCVRIFWKNNGERASLEFGLRAVKRRMELEVPPGLWWWSGWVHGWPWGSCRPCRSCCGPSQAAPHASGWHLPSWWPTPAGRCWGGTTSCGATVKVS